MQLRHGGFQRFKQIAVVQAVHQVHDDFGVGLALKHIALGLQGGAQLVVVFNDAVVHQCHPARPCIGAGTRAVAEMRMRVVHRRRAVRGPAGVRNAGAPCDAFALDLALQLGHPRDAAGPLQAARMHRYAAGVVAAVFEPLQALYQDGNNVAVRNRRDDAAHGRTPSDGYGNPKLLATIIDFYFLLK